MKTLFTGNSGNGSNNGSGLYCTRQEIENESGMNQQANALEQCEQDEHIDGFEKVLVIISVLLFLILNS